MYLVGNAAGLLAFFIVSALVGGSVHDPGAGLFAGLVAAIWAAWPFHHQHAVTRQNFFHPAPRRYQQPTKIVFSQIRDLLRESAYNFGDKWRVSTADATTGRIFAELRYFDEETHTDFSSGGRVHIRKERLQRYLSLEVQMKDEKSCSVVQYDFDARVEGTKYGACDEIVLGIMDALEHELGPSTDVGDLLSEKLPAPPWWLLAVTAGALLLLFQVIAKTAA
jgi:hypothetical protein